MYKLLLLLPLAIPTTGDTQSTKLPVLFQFHQPSHSVSVFRGASLNTATSQGGVRNEGYLGSGAGAGGGDGDGGDKDIQGGDGGIGGADTYSAPVTIAPTPPPTPAPTTLPPSTYAPTTPSPVTYAPTDSAPITYSSTTSAPITYAPPTYTPTYSPRTYAPSIKYAPAPTRVVYKPTLTPPVYQRPIHYAPAPSYKAAPSYEEPAQYIWEYKVLDDYSANDFGAKESRSGDLTEGQYYVRLPDSRLLTVTYTVDGDLGYLPIVEYQGEAQYQGETQYQ